jgi:hypothetical protein
MRSAALALVVALMAATASAPSSHAGAGSRTLRGRCAWQRWTSLARWANSHC